MTPHLTLWDMKSLVCYTNKHQYIDKNPLYATFHSITCSKDAETNVQILFCFVGACMIYWTLYSIHGNCHQNKRAGLGGSNYVIIP